MVRRARSEIVDRLGAIASVAKQFEDWRPAGEVLTRVKVVPTIFAQVNRATRLGGWPLQRIALVHGRSSEGKTSFCHGLGLSFLKAFGFYGFIDAEMTTPEDWLQKLMTKEFAAHPGFVAMRPRGYEQTVVAVRQFCERIQAAREDGTLPEETPAIIVLDSVRKLVPERLMEKLLKEEGGVDGAGGRGAMIKAALNGQWMDELVPLMHHTGCTMVLIARESENVAAAGDKYAPEYKLQGGKAIVFDSSLIARVERDGWVTVGKSKTSQGQVVGESHRVRIRKTKVSALEGKHTDCWFHTSNGAVSPEGFDLARDAFDLAVRLQVIKQSGSRYAYGGEQLGNGEHQAVARIAKDAELLAELQGRLELGEGEVPAEAEEAAQRADEAEHAVQPRVAAHQRSRAK